MAVTMTEEVAYKELEDIQLGYQQQVDILKLQMKQDREMFQEKEKEFYKVQEHYEQQLQAYDKALTKSEIKTMWLEKKQVEFIETMRDESVEQKKSIPRKQYKVQEDSRMHKYLDDLVEEKQSLLSMDKEQLMEELLKKHGGR